MVFGIKKIFFGVAVFFFRFFGDGMGVLFVEYLVFLFIDGYWLCVIFRISWKGSLCGRFWERILWICFNTGSFKFFVE